MSGKKGKERTVEREEHDRVGRNCWEGMSLGTW